MKPLLIAALILAAGCAGQGASPKAIFAGSAYSFSCSGADLIEGATGTTGEFGTGAWVAGTHCVWNCASLDGAAPGRIEVIFTVTSGGSYSQKVDSQPCQ